MRTNLIITANFIPERDLETIEGGVNLYLQKFSNLMFHYAGGFELDCTPYSVVCSVGGTLERLSQIKIINPKTPIMLRDVKDWNEVKIFKLTPTDGWQSNPCDSELVYSSYATPKT